MLKIIDVQPYIRPLFKNYINYFSGGEVLS